MNTDNSGEVGMAHPVKNLLVDHINKSFGNTVVERLIVEYGRPFVVIKRPKGFRLGPLKQCFKNASKLACHDVGIYVEGFMYEPEIGMPFHHAWLTTDGVNAIDVTERSPGKTCSYFGVPFSVEILRESMQRRGTYTLLDASYDTHEMEQMLQDNRLCPPGFPQDVAAEPSYTPSHRF